MRIEVANTLHHPVVNFVVHAETPTEAVLLQQFWRVGYAAERHRLFMHSCGGNVSENVASFCFGWRKESDFKLKSWWRRIWTRGTP